MSLFNPYKFEKYLNKRDQQQILEEKEKKRKEIHDIRNNEMVKKYK